jgi:hypothetical protein
MRNDDQADNQDYEWDEDHEDSPEEPLGVSELQILPENHIGLGRSLDLNELSLEPKNNYKFKCTFFAHI